jgi:acetoin utilization deacetylase AcuC-like enzyme
MDAAVIWDEAYAEHDTGEHPEGADRVATMVEHLERTDLWPRLTVFDEPRPATEEEILLVHTPAHLRVIKQAAQGRGAWLDPDTHVSARSYEIALLSAGGALLATDVWDDGLVPFALIRPPGHHATPDRAMGFCLFNNIAVAAARLLDRGCERVAILDWDVHHGNGTQAAFYAEPRVLFASAHEWPHYPGSGFFTECGEGAGEGFTVNVPLPAGAMDADYASVFDDLFGPIVRQFRPQALLVSAGQDIHQADPLGDMRVSETGFAQMALRCVRLAQELCEGRLAFVLEGGYQRTATARSVEAVLRAVADESAPEIAAAAAAGTEKAAVAIARAREVQSAYWEL